MDRRDFLARTAWLAAASAAASNRISPAAEPPRRRWTMRLSTSSVQFSSVSVEKSCEQIAGLGFEAVDFWNSRYHCPHLDEIEKRLGPEGLKELLARHKLKLCAFSYLPDYRRYAELLGKAGGGLAICGTPAGKVRNLTGEMKAFLEKLKPEIELAEKNNTRIAVENHAGNLLNDLDSFKALVDLNRNPRLGIALAPFHLQALGASVEKAIEISGEQLFFFYAWQQADLKKDPNVLKQLPGIGPTDFTPWLAALGKIDYRGYVNPFMHGHPANDVMVKSLAASRDYLKKCCDRAA
jgi:sugar phosphate isomerase/epimerase